MGVITARVVDQNNNPIAGAYCQLYLENLLTFPPILPHLVDSQTTGSNGMVDLDTRQWFCFGWQYSIVVNYQDQTQTKPFQLILDPRCQDSTQLFQFTIDNPPPGCSPPCQPPLICSPSHICVQCVLSSDCPPDQVCIDYSCHGTDGTGNGADNTGLFILLAAIGVIGAAAYYAYGRK